MLESAGTALNTLLTGGARVPGGNGVLQQKSGESLLSQDNEGALRSVIADLVDLSEEARARLGDERKALGALISGSRGGDLPREQIHLIREQLGEIRNQIGSLRNLLRDDLPAQREPLLRGLEELTHNLEDVGRQLGLIQPEASIEVQQSSVQLESFSLTASFNRSVSIQTSDGQSIEFQQSINIDFSFLKITQSEQNLSITTGDNGLTVSQTSQQSTLVQAQLNVSVEQSLVIENQDGTGGVVNIELGVGAGAGAGPETGAVPNVLDFPGSEADPDPLESLIATFSQEVKSFQELLDEFQRQFQDEERLPQSLFQVIRGILESALEPGSLHHIDEVA